MRKPYDATMRMASHRRASSATLGLLLVACGVDSRIVSVAERSNPDAIGYMGGAGGVSSRGAGGGSAGASALAPSGGSGTTGGVSAAAGASGGLGVDTGSDGGSSPLAPPSSAVRNPFDLASYLDPTSTGLYVGGNSELFRSTGIAVAGGADVDGDALADFAVGVSQYDTVGNRVFGRGAVFVVSGDPRREHVTLDDVPSAVPGIRVEGQADGGYGSLGYYLVMIGDVNGDGISDFMTSTAFDTASLEYSAPGSYLVIFGRAPGSNVDIGRIVGGQGDGFMITSEGYLDAGLAGPSNPAAPFAPAGDVNGDSVADILLVAGITGLGYVLFGKGSPSPVPLSDIEANLGGWTYRVSGALVAPFVAVGDVNGDGVTDLAACYYPDDGSGVRVRVIFGQREAAGPVVADDTNGFDVIPEQSGWFLSIAAAGDVNGDGRGDVLVGTPLEDGGDISGAAYVVFGTADPSPVYLGSQIGNFAIYGAPPLPDSFSGFGTALMSAGDINADGLADLLVTDPEDDSVYLIFGKPDESPVFLATLEDTARGRRVLHLEPPDPTTPRFYRYTPAGLGRSISAAGDIDGDGRRDFVIGAPNARVSDIVRGPGAAFVLFGAALSAPAAPP
jgi:hypothetical protein